MTTKDKISSIDRKNIANLIKKGYSQKSIAKKLKVTRGTINYQVRAYGLIPFKDRCK